MIELVMRAQPFKIDGNVLGRSTVQDDRKVQEFRSKYWCICRLFSQINDVPVTHLSDIEPLVYESTSTIKFLVARPAQEVCTNDYFFLCTQG